MLWGYLDAKRRQGYRVWQDGNWGIQERVEELDGACYGRAQVWLVFLVCHRRAESEERKYCVEAAVKNGGQWEGRVREEDAALRKSEAGNLGFWEVELRGRESQSQDDVASVPTSLSLALKQGIRLFYTGPEVKTQLQQPTAKFHSYKLLQNVHHWSIRDHQHSPPQEMQRAILPKERNPFRS